MIAASPSMPKVGRLNRSLLNVARNSAYLYGVQLCRKVFPLITIPYLTRVLGLEGWGTVAFIQSLAEIVALVIEFGFNLSATREVSRARNNVDECRGLMAGVLGSQVMLASAALTIVLLVKNHLPLGAGNSALVVAGCVYAVAQGFSPLWFFQGLEKMALAAGLEIGARVCALAGLFLLVRHPGDAWIALSLQAFTAGISTVAGIAIAYRTFGFERPSLGLISDALRRGWRMFVFRSAESLYGVGNSFVLGLFAGPVIVGYFALAEKISKAMFGLLNPVREALYPKLAYLMESSERDAARLARVGIAVMTVAGAVLTSVMYVFAPDLIRILGGPQFELAIPVLRIMSLLPLILSITYSVGLQWLIPLGREAVVNRIIICAGLFNLLLAFSLASRFGAIGMAASVLSAETLVCGSLLLIVWRSTNLWQDFSLAVSFSETAPRTVSGNGAEGY
jgi:PST family polysaccharide transporter